MLPSADLNAASQCVGLGRILLACFGSQRLESGEPLSPSFLSAVLLSQELWRREKKHYLVDSIMVIEHRIFQIRML